jgi:hypothetical protein
MEGGEEKRMERNKKMKRGVGWRGKKMMYGLLTGAETSNRIVPAVHCLPLWWEKNRVSGNFYSFASSTSA